MPPGRRGKFGFCLQGWKTVHPGIPAGAGGGKAHGNGKKKACHSAISANVLGRGIPSASPAVIREAKDSIFLSVLLPLAAIGIARSSHKNIRKTENDDSAGRNQWASLSEACGIIRLLCASGRALRASGQALLPPPAGPLLLAALFLPPPVGLLPLAALFVLRLFVQQLHVCVQFQLP